MDTERTFQLKAQNGHQYTRLEEPGGEFEGRLPGYLPPPGTQDLGPSDFEFDPYTESESDRQNGLAASSDRTPEMVLEERSWTSGELALRENLTGNPEATKQLDHLESRKSDLHNQVEIGHTT